MRYLAAAVLALTLSTPAAAQYDGCGPYGRKVCGYLPDGRYVCTCTTR